MELKQQKDELTVKNIKEAEIEQLAELIGQAKAVVIYQYFHREENLAESE